MKLKVICKKCDRIFSWNAENSIEDCPYCDSQLTIKDVRMNPQEMARYKKYQESNKYTTNEPQETKQTQKIQTTPEPVLKTKKEKTDEIEGRFIIKKGKTKYGTLELTNPDYMILKMSFWAMGPQQKEITSSLTKKIINDLIRNGFEIKKK
jgi:DNA-directed RNA polymerase subunit RPC12/RpoP